MTPREFAHVLRFLGGGDEPPSRLALGALMHLFPDTEDRQKR
jgi:hypothetical protein